MTRKPSVECTLPVMAEKQSEMDGVKNLWGLCLKYCKENLAISPDLLRDLPFPVVEELAVCLSPHDLFTLEGYLNNREVTQKAWFHHCELLHLYNKMGEKCFHCCEGLDIHLTYRDLYLTHTVRRKMIYASAARMQTRYGKGSAPTLLDLCIAKEVKRLVIQLDTLLNLSPLLLNAFTTNLVALKVTHHGQFEGSTRWLQALAEMTYRGQLRSLEIFCMGPFEDIWLQVFFIISGLFGCRLCAQHFAAAVARANEVSSATHDKDPWDEDCVESSHETPEGFVSCSGAAGSSQAQDSSVSASHANWRVHKLRDDLHQFWGGLPTNFLSAMQKVGYSGLPEEEDLKFDTACGSQGDGLKDEPKRKRPIEDFSYSDTDILMMEALGLFKNEQLQKAHSSSENSVRFVEALSNFHREEGHAGRGLEHFLVSWARGISDSRNDLPQVTPFDKALGSCVPGWSALTSISLDTEAFNNDACDLGECLTKGLLHGISEETLQSVSVSVPRQQLCWLWAVLQILSGTQQTGNSKRTQPMRLLKIRAEDILHSRVVHSSSCCFQENDPDGSECGPQVDIPGIGIKESTGTSFPGLQELYLEEMMFDHTGSFSRLGEFIREDCDLRHISLVDCMLDGASVSLLLTALCSGVRPLLTCVDLQGSLNNVSDSQWEKLCQLIFHCPCLTRLSLAQCLLKREHVQSDEFANAVKSHHTSRRLDLDISDNFLGDAVWEFMEKAVCPESSLKELNFMETGSTTMSGLAILTRIVHNQADHLPLLEACSWTRLFSGSCSDSLRKLLKQLCQSETNKLLKDQEFLLMMGFRQ